MPYLYTKTYYRLVLLFRQYYTILAFNFYIRRFTFHLKCLFQKILIHIAYVTTDCSDNIHLPEQYTYQQLQMPYLYTKTHYRLVLLFRQYSTILALNFYIRRFTFHLKCLFQKILIHIAYVTTDCSDNIHLPEQYTYKQLQMPYLYTKTHYRLVLLFRQYSTILALNFYIRRFTFHLKCLFQKILIHIQYSLLIHMEYHKWLS